MKNTTLYVPYGLYGTVCSLGNIWHRMLPFSGPDAPLLGTVCFLNEGQKIIARQSPIQELIQLNLA